MKLLLHSLFLLLAFETQARTHSCDVVIVGGTPAGITAAIAAAREGKNSVILERSAHIGGLPANGLGATDIATRGATAGLFARFIALNKAYYESRYGADSPQARDCSDGYRFEPAVAQRTFERMLAEAGPGKITVLTGRQFDAEARYVVKKGDRIVSIRVLDRTTGREEHYSGAMFIDATYEGDLGAAAGVPFRTGREGAGEYGEPCAGKIYRWWKHGPDADGTTYEGDDAIQAYNYRLCLTEEYVSLVGDVLDGRNTDARYRKADSAAIARNRRRIESGERTAAPGDVWGMAKITSMTRLPNAKTDANNQHLALISTDLPEENWPWPTADWAWRDRFAERLRDYTLGLLWFAQHDEALPAHFREACLQWGLAADEYRDNGGFPRQVYVFFSHPTAVYTVPYGVMVPRRIENLLFPAAVSGSHVGFSTLRMEPCWMALGEAAGTAAALAIDSRKDVREIPTETLQERLLRHGAMLVYLRDLKADDPDYARVQRLALRGFFPEWEAGLDRVLDGETARLWSTLAGREITADGTTTRREWLRRITTNQFLKPN